MNKYNLSLAPIKINKILLKNKIVCSPVGINMSETDGKITNKEIGYFENLAKNNLGMIIVGNATVSNMGKGTLNEIDLEIDARAATTIMLVSGGYPKAYEKGKEITGIDAITESIPFHAGAQLKDGKVVTSGGRVISITSYGDTYQEAIKKSYQSIEKLNFDKMYYRKDIGFVL